MQKIDPSAIRGCEISGRLIRPAAVSAICPKCNAKVIFTLYGFSTGGHLNSVSAAGNCPSCNGKVGFWSINTSGVATIHSAEIYMHPSPQNFFPEPSEVDFIPSPLRRALISTIESYNAGIYAAAAVSGRRTLEGIFKFLVPEEKRNLPLAKLIDAAKEEKDLSAPLSALSHAIRSGGNLGAHFDMELEPDEAVARQIVELLSYLISYLYVLPARIEQLESDLSKIDPAN
ncbi:DUF4145 domain-containing protein [Ferrovibrio sp.]|uniref:DUF4145 domain-containing protein n=1 Tax=Ferrovibrio sp. TaxID=1917215 RepID=UPI0025B82E44|nr:DUF4145 domain-containing protein [Ferrovibrio sp.]MBX3453778.1 DUF4145 domain-containing protein [Ferrovibrio sp.]